MTLKLPVVALLAVLLLVLTPLGAGCLSIPGPEDTKKTPVVTAVTTTPHVVKTTAVRTTVPPVTTVPATTTPVPATSTPYTAAASSGTCSQIGGTVVAPGYSCPGTWLAASDTFSCCSTIPVPETYGSSNASVMAIPSAFSLDVNLDDDPGSISP